MPSEPATRSIENEALVRDLVAWVAAEPKTYSEVMDAWRTSCPRLPVWEEAVRLGLITREYRPGVGAMVFATPAGRDFLGPRDRP